MLFMESFVLCCYLMAWTLKSILVMKKKKKKREKKKILNKINNMKFRQVLWDFLKLLL